MVEICEDVVKEMSILPINWSNVVIKSRNLNYKDRRKFIKKFKRKAARRLKTCQQNETAQCEFDRNIEKNIVQQKALVDYFAIGPLMPEVFKILNAEEHKNQNQKIYTAAAAVEAVAQVSSTDAGSPSISSINKTDSNGKQLDELNQLESAENHCGDDQKKKDDEIEALLETIDAEVQEWHNPYAKDSDPSPPHNHETTKQPELQSQQTVLPQEPLVPAATNGKDKRERCFFYDTMGCCKFGDTCDRRHKAACKTATILIPGMFKAFALDMSSRVKRIGGTQGDVHDLALEYGDEDMYDNFIDFSEDVLKELRKYGRVVQFKVCCNRTKHLQGNVYVEYDRKREAKKAFEKLNNRFYDGKLLQCKMVKIRSWKNAICGMHYRRGNCSHGDACNFLHVFKDKSRKFYWADQDRY